MLGQMCFCLFLILLISCSDVAASIVADETNSGVTAFVAEITSYVCGLKWDGIAAINSLDYLPVFIIYVASRHSSSFRVFPRNNKVWAHGPMSLKFDGPFL